MDHDGRFERDAFDPFYDHLVLVDASRDDRNLDHVVGVYRLIGDYQAARCGRFYSEDEYDLRVLKSSGRRLLELGRSCVHPDYRSGVALHMLWSGLANYVREREFEVLFGVASFHGTEVAHLAQPLSHLHYAHLAPPDLRVRAVADAFQPMDLVPRAHVNRLEAMKNVPPLIKSYLRLGGFVGDGAFVDRTFNTVDVCLVMDTERMSEKAKARYETGQLA